MRIGVFGGSFNPIHMGHLAVASEVAWAIGMDRVYFVVSARHPHKEGADMIDSRVRLEMVKAAIKGNPLFRPSEVELKRKGPSYTIDTMRQFKEEFGPDIHFITGQDAMEDIGSWKSASSLLKTYNFAVATRPGYDSETLLDVLQGVLAVKYVNVKLRTVSKGTDGAVETTGVAGSSSVINMVRVTPLDISSSRIRERIKNDEPVKYLVPEAVERYLNKKNLFPGLD